MIFTYLIPLLLLLLLSGGISFGIPTINLTDYKIQEEGVDLEDGALFEIQGNRSGFTAWLLDKLSIRDREIRFLFFEESSLRIEGKDTFERMSTRDTYTSNIGYSKAKILLIFSIIGLFATLASLINFFDYGDDFTPVLFTGFLAWLFYFLYKRSSMIKLVTKTAGGSAMGINIRKGDKTVSEEDLEKIKNILHSSIESSSRFYNTHYSK